MRLARSFRRLAVLTTALVLSTVVARPASAQLVLKNADETMNIKFGLLAQVWGDWAQDPASGGYAQNLFLRRIRVLVGGQVMPGLTFFAETDNPNLGKSVSGTKTISSGFILQDAYVEYKKIDGIFVDAGLILVPFCRNCLNSAATHMALDYGTYSFLQSGPEQAVTGRDTGFQVRGFVADGRLEYRVAVEQGVRQTGSRNAFRYNARVQYSFLEAEKVAFFYPGTYFGKKKALAVGLAYDAQQDYEAYAADVFFDHPLGGGLSTTLEANLLHYDGKTFLTALPRQTDFMAQAGLFASNAKLFPYVRYESKSHGDDVNVSKNETRFQVGVGYFLKGHNATLKAAYTRVSPETGSSSDQVSVQLQGFYF